MKYYVRVVEPQQGDVWHAVKEFPNIHTARRDYADRIGLPVANVASRMTVVPVPKQFAEARVTEHYTCTPKSMQEFLMTRLPRPLIR